MRVLITGAAGFIGRALAERYRGELGAEVVEVDLTLGHDVSQAGPWQELAAGCDVVIHTAAIVSMRLERADEVWRVNVVGTRNALEAAERAGAERFVHFSSVTVFGFDFPDAVTERDPVQPTGVPYPDSKIASEQLVLQAHAEGRVPVTVIRPGDVYGPRSRPWAVLPVEHMKARRFSPPLRGIFSPVYVDNLVDGVVAAAAAPAAAGQVLTISDGVGVPNGEFFGRYADALGIRLRDVPLPVLRAAAAVTQRVMRLRPGDNDINPATIRYMSRRGTYSNAKAREMLGWQPRVDLDTGLDRTVAWLREAGHA